MAADAFRAALDKIVSTIEGLTPPVTDSGSKTSYEFIDTLVEERGHGQHRELFFTMPDGMMHEHSTPLTLRWRLEMQLFLHRRPPGTSGRTHDSFLRAVAQEIEEVLFTMSEITNWGNANVVEVLHDGGISIEGLEGERPTRGGGVSNNEVVVVTFPLTIVAQRGS